MFKVTRKFCFRATRSLARNHSGESMVYEDRDYKVEVLSFAEKLNGFGYIEDCADLERFGAWLQDNVRGRKLNDVFMFNPTTENLTRYFFGVCKSMAPATILVRVSEDDVTWITYSLQEPR